MKSRSLLVLLALVPVLSTVIVLGTPVLGSHAAAATAPLPVDARVFSRQSYLMMTSQCGWTRGVGAIRAVAEPGIPFTPANGWMATDHNGANMNKSVGSAFRKFIPMNDDTARMDCDNAEGWVDKTLQVWNFKDPITFLWAVRDAGGLNWNKDMGAFSTKDGSNSNAENAAITKVVQKTPFSGATKGLAPDEQYYDWLVNFETQCSATFSNSPAATSTEINGIMSAQALLNGTPTPGYWHFDKRVGIDVDVGTALIASDGGSNCPEIANHVGNPILINAYAAYVKAGGTAPAVTGGGAAATSPDCESQGGALGWVLCPIIDGLAKTIDGLYSTMIQPLLVTRPIDILGSSSDPTHTYQIWSNFRIYGNIFLVIALLVIVFGQSIGGGMIEAYTAKKVLPRLLVAAVMVNLSIYLVAFAVDLTNILGNGLATIISAPFAQTPGFFKLSISGTTGGIGLTAIVGTAFWAAISAGPLWTFIWTFFLMPVLLTVLAILVTVVIRRGLIILLIIASPVAFALYCLPNTEKYFKKWWDLLIKTLLVYPIIAVIFAIANILAVTINSTSQSGGITGVVGQFVSVAALVVPLFLIPFAFKLAGGVIGQLHGALGGISKRGAEAYKGNANDPNSRRNRARNGLEDRNILSRERGVSRVGGLQKAGVTDNQSAQTARWKRRLGRTLSPVGRVLNSGDLEAKRSALTKKQAELREQKTGYGPDDSVRAFYAKKGDDGLWRSSTSGKVFSDLDVQKANSLYGRGAGLSASQAAINYELGKAGNDSEYNKFLAETPAMLEKKGYNHDEINGIMKGVGYANQAKRLDLKHSSFSKNEDTGLWKRRIDYATMSQDAAENFGSYPISNMKDSPLLALSEGHTAAQGAIADAALITGTDDASNKARQDVFDKAGFKAAALSDGTKMGGQALAERTIADNKTTAKILDTRMRQGQGIGSIGDDGTVIPSAPGIGSGANISSGSGHVDAAIADFVNQVNGPLHPRPGGPIAP